MTESARILAVDDNAEALTLLVRSLKEAGGYEVRSAVSGDSAFRMATADPPELILMETRMEGLGGLELCRQLKMGEDTREIPVILMTAHPDEEDWRSILEAGAADFITKPFKEGELLVRVETHLALRRATARIQEQERDLVATKERLERTIEAAHLGTWEWNAQTGETTFNEIWAHHLGYTLEELSPVSIETWHTLSHPDDLHEAKRLLERHFAGEVPFYECETRMRHKDGRWIWIHDRGRVTTRTSDGMPLMMFGVHSDVTERKLAEEALRESEERFRTVLQTAMDGFWVTDTEGKIKAVNEAYCHMSGYDADELLTMTIAELEASERPEDIAAHLAKVMEKGEDRFESRHRRKDGTVVEVEASVKYGPEEGGRFVVFLKDITQRKRSEAALEARRSQIDQAMDLAKLAEWEFDIQTETFTFNDRFYALYGTTAAREGGYRMSAEKYAREFLHPDDRHLVAAEVERARNATDPSFISQVEHRIVRRDGEVRHVAVRFGITQDATGRTIRTNGANQDITDRKEAEQARVHSHDLMAYIIEHNRSAIAVHDKDMKYVFVSQRYLQEYNVREADIIGKHHYEVFPDLPQKWRDVHQRALAGEVSSAEDDPYYRDDGTLEWTRWECRPWYEADGSIGGLIVYTEVITPRKKVEEALRESERRYHALFTHANEGLLMLTPEGQLADVNDAFARMHGYSVEEIMDRDIQTLDVLEDQAMEARADIGKRLHDGETVRFEVEHFHRDGHVFPLSVTASLIEIDGQAFYLSSHQDITELRAAEEERRELQHRYNQAQKMESVGRLAGGVAHDFNNMLSVIIGYTESLLMDTDSSDPIFGDLSEIEKAARRSADLTRQLLAFARKQVATPRVLDLNELTRNTLGMLRRLLGEDLELVWVPGAELWPVEVDPAQIDQILANLCVNARDAISDVGTVTIRTRNVTFDEETLEEQPDLLEGDFVVLAVSDDGSGMPDEIREHIFEPFFTTKGQGQGTGLGLATVYGIVRQNGGFLTVDSELGKGSTFHIHLPRYRGVAAPGEGHRPDSRPTGKGETLLLVEDEASVLVVAGNLMRELGYQVLPASTPGEAIALMEDRPGAIDLLVTDVVMPEMNGRDLADRLRKIRPELKCLFVSGYTADVIAHHGVLEKGTRFLQKPFTSSRLAIALREALDEEPEALEG